MRGEARRQRIWGAAVLAAVALAAPTACSRHTPPPATEVAAVRRAALPSTPDDPAWRDIPAYAAALLPQDMVEPRLLTPSTPQVQVQAATDGTRIAFRLAWTDSTMNDLPGASRFIDACAVQLPAENGPNLPAPQMGETGGRVEITYWSAAWQARAHGRPDSIQALYPNAKIDHYPFEAAPLGHGTPEQQEMAKRYAPARAANRPEHPADRAVQDLIAEGPGTLTPAPETRSTGEGSWAKGMWAVVVIRPLPDALRGQPRSQVAFAVWNGSKQEVGARKMRSVWIPLSMGGAS
jgi:ethylbenzene dehydrogenase